MPHTVLAQSVILASLKLTNPELGGKFKKQKASLILKPSSPQEETCRCLVVWLGLVSEPRFCFAEGLLCVLAMFPLPHKSFH